MHMCDSEHSGHFLTSSFGRPIKAERFVHEEAANKNQVLTNICSFLNYSSSLPGNCWEKVSKFNTKMICHRRSFLPRSLLFSNTEPPSCCCERGPTHWVLLCRSDIAEVGRGDSCTCAALGAPVISASLASISLPCSRPFSSLLHCFQNNTTTTTTPF